MKCVMYHYIRNKDVNFPYSKVLTKTEFNKQLKKFEKNGFINNYSELFENSKKMLLTFDDGFKDHIYAAEKLKKLNCTGLFFIPTLPLRKKEILDVHKVHLLVGKVKGKTILFEMEKYLQKNNITNLINLNDRESLMSSSHFGSNLDISKLKMSSSERAVISFNQPSLSALCGQSVGRPCRFDISVHSTAV